MSQKIVCFDLGGVAVRIATTWQQACANAGLATTPTASTFSDLEPFELYQAGKITSNDYISRLAVALELSPEQSSRVHSSILMGEFDGIDGIGRRLGDRRVATGCLSNTNELHWSVMTDPARFPTVSSFEVKVASHLVCLSKPEPAIYEHFERASGRAGPDIVYFDDVQPYVDAALARGWIACRIDPKAGPSAQIAAFLEREGLI